MFNLSEEEITRRLASAWEESKVNVSTELPDLRGEFNTPPVPSAVLIPLFKNEEAWHLLFIRRTVDQHEHSNQVAFPGGRADPLDDSPEQTALREASEEIGIAPREVKILGKLRDFLTVTNYLITPIAGVIPWPYPFRLASHEVSHIFTIPLAWLADPRNHEIRQHTFPSPFTTIPVVYFNSYNGEVLWGASARITLTLLEILEV